MSQRTKIVGARAPIIWLLVIIALVIIAGLAVGGLVVYPHLQEQRAEQTRLAQAEQHYQAGVAFQNVSDWEAAEAEFKQAISIDANYKDVQARLAEVRDRLAESEATATAVAMAQAERARAAAQATATVQAQVTAEAQAEQHYQAGVAFQNVSDWEAAEAEFKQVIALDANYRDVQTRLAEVKARLAESEATATAVAMAQAEQARAAAQATATVQAQATAEAQANAQATAAAAPTATTEALEAHYQKGLGYMNMGRWEEAKAELEQVFEVDPNYKEVQTKLAEVEVEIANLTPTATPEPPTPEATNTPVATATPESLFSDNFDDGDAQEWTVIGSQAKVVDGKYAAIGDPIVVTLAGSETWRNYSVRVKVKIVSGKGDFGILVRASEDCRLYQLQFVDGAMIARYDGGNCADDRSYSWAKLASSSYRIDEGTWYNIRVDVQGTAIIGYVNGAQVISADDAFYSQGKIGFRANNTQMFFDDVEVVPLPKP